MDILEEAHIFIDSIMKIFPEYKDDIIHYYFKSNKFTQCNMFVTSKEQYDNYCSFYLEYWKMYIQELKFHHTLAKSV